MKNKISIQSRILIRLIYFFMELPFMNGKTFLDLSIKLSNQKSKFRIPKDYELINHKIENIEIEQLINTKNKKEYAILQLHGGAYLKKYYDIYRIIAYRYTKIAKDTTVYSLDYRIAPEYTFPCALLDAQKAWDFILNQGFSENRIIVVGDSAGGNLALALTMKLRDQQRKLPMALVLMSPWADLSASGPSYIYNIHKDPIFGARKKTPNIFDMQEKILAYAKGADLTNKYLSPIYGNFHDFPPMLIQVGTNEIIESDSITLYEKAKEANVQVRLSRYYGMFHDFQLFLNLLPESKHAWKEVQEFIEHHQNKSPNPKV